MRPDIDEERFSSVRTALGWMTADDLKKLAALTGERAPSRKPDMIDVIHRHLEGERLRTVWEGLDELQRAAVAEVVHSPSDYFSASRFRAKYGQDPNWGSKENYRYNPSPLGFFFYSGIMPPDLKRRLEAFVPKPRPTVIEVLDELPTDYGVEVKYWNAARSQETKIADVPLAVHERELAAQRELISVLRFVDSGKVAVSDKTRRASASTVEAITALLEGGDYYAYVKPEREWNDKNAGPIRAFAWPLLIQAGGLAQLSGTRLQLTRAGRKALSDPPALTLRTLWKKWAGTTILDELSRIECVKGQTGKGKRHLTAVSSRREAIEHSLAECPVSQWMHAETFWRYMRASGRNCDVTRDGWGLYIGELQYGSLGYDGSDRILNERYLLGVLLEYVSTLGMIDVALIPPAAGARVDYRDLWGTDELPFFSRYDGLMYIRFTSLGAYCLGVESNYQPAPVVAKPVLRVMPNLEIAAAGLELEPSDRLALDAYATRVSDSVWILESGKLLTAIEGGRQLEEVREFLIARSGAELPETVVQLLADVEARTTMFHDRGLARLIECADSALAAMVARDTRTRKHCMRAGDRHLIVPASSEAAFRRGLRDGGYIVAAGKERPAKGGVAKPPVAEG